MVTIQQAFELALQHHQSGRLGEAEAIYRRILAAEPRHAESLHLLGVIAHQMGRNDLAVNLIHQAIALAPGVADFYSNLGETYRAARKLDQAIAACLQAIELDPNSSEAHNNLGAALKDKGQLDQAIAACRQAISIKPNYPEAHSNLGIALYEKGQLDEAIAAYRQAIAFRPNYAEAHSNLGVALYDTGQLDEAIAAYRQAILLKSSYTEAHSNLGAALKEKGQLDEAIAACRQAIALDPNHPESHGNLGNVLGEMGRLEEASACFQKAIALKPSYPDAYYNFARVLRDMGRLDESIAAYRQAIALKPNHPKALNNLGNVLKDKGQLDEADAAFSQAISFKPDYSGAHSNLVYALHFHADSTPESIYKVHRLWNDGHAAPLRSQFKPHANDREPNRRLRIGYVSPDFSAHPVGRFLAPLLAHHDPSAVEIYCYADVLVPDELTTQLRSSAHAWRSITGLSDAQVAEQIRADRIDILVDLTMHMARNRLLVFARKPAPVQATYLAYCSTTGLDAIDYRITDPYLDAPESDTSCYSEQSIWLKESYWCYQAPPVPIQPSALPALSTGKITFGCLNNFCKISSSCLACWSKLLQAIPDSSLLLHSYEGSHRQKLKAKLEEQGIHPDRIRFVGHLPMPQYLALYQQMDIALDPFPYNGGTTSCDALWMGVPVVTLIGQTAVGRAGLSLLMNLKLPELVASTPEAYVQIASNLAGNLSRLTDFRSTLRQHMERSPLMDAPRFARDVESAYREMWERWCAEKSTLLP